MNEPLTPEEKWNALSEWLSTRAALIIRRQHLLEELPGLKSVRDEIRFLNSIGKDKQ